MKTVVVLIDGGFLRSMAKAAKIKYDPAFIEKFAKACISADENCLRILYYDCAPFQGTALLPVSGKVHTFSGSDQWLHDIAALDLFAVRRGVLKFRGFQRSPKATGTLTDADFNPQFEQKGVDMRIGLDIASYSSEHLAKRIVLITNDTDCVPAMKYARIAGLQTVLIEVPNCRPAPELIAHSDYKRSVGWP